MRGRTPLLVLLALPLLAAGVIACGGSTRATVSPTSRHLTPARTAATDPATARASITASLTVAQRSAATVAPLANTPTPAAPGGLYLALGDSLSFGIGASDPSTTGFVALVHASLGSRYELLNLGVPGDTSQDLIDHGNLARAVQEITRRKADGDATNDVRVLTLEIGGNDLLRLYGSFVQTGICPDAQTLLDSAECSDALRSAFDTFRPNLATTLDRLRAADPSLRILLLTLYNPFDYVPGVAELGDLSLEGMAGTAFADGLNDIIRAVAQGRGDATVVDIFPRFHGRAAQLTAGDHIHPNDAGYRVMADAIIAALPARR